MKFILHTRPCFCWCWRHVASFSATYLLFLSLIHKNKKDMILILEILPNIFWQEKYFQICYFILRLFVSNVFFFYINLYAFFYTLQWNVEIYAHMGQWPQQVFPILLYNLFHSWFSLTSVILGKWSLLHLVLNRWRKGEEIGKEWGIKATFFHRPV